MHPQTTVIIILSVVLGASLLSLSLAMVLVARFLWSHKDTATTKGTKQQQQQNQQNTMQLEKQIQDHQHSPLSTDRPWSRIFAPKRDRGHAVPTLSSIIKAGDETLYTSTLFHSLHGHPGPLPLESLLNAFAEELRRRTLKERSAYPADMSRFVSTARRVASTHKRTQSHMTTHSTTSQDASQKPRGKSFDLDRELGRAMSISRKVTPVLVPVVQSAAGEGPQSGAWMKDMQRVEFVEGRPSLRVTSSELAALSAILGASVNTESGGSGDESSDDSSVTDKGAFGISIYASKAKDGSYNVHLKQHKLKISQLPSRGSGFSTLYAKHFASGSLPFAQDKKTVSSVLVTDETVGAIKSGTSLHLQKCTPHTQGSKFLATLPNTHTTVFHTLAPSTESTSIPLLLHTIADLPFNGGLVPLVTTPIIQTIQFITSGGLPPARLLQRLDALVDKVHRHAPHLQLFGPLFDDKNAGRRLREHERLGKIATDPEALEKEPLAYKVARMQRYVTLIERLMVLVPDMKAAEVREKVREATRKEVERAYGEAISAYKDGNANTPLVSTLPARDVKSTKRDSTISFSVSVSRNSHSTRTSSQRSSIASSSSTAPIQQPTATSTSASSRTVSSTSTSGSISRHSSTFPTHNAGKLIENVLKENLPLDVKTIGLVARMVILAWTCSVGVVGEEGLQGIGMEMQTGSQEIRIW